MPFEFVPQKLVYGGDALGHFQGRTVLVPRTLPGERVEAEPVRSARGVVHARPLRVLAAAPERVEPACPYFGRCGGCQYQHLNAADETNWKREILRETLRRIGRIVWEGEIPVHAAEPWGYRNQAQLKISRGAVGRLEVGFFAAESHQLVAVDRCPILSPQLNAVLGALGSGEWGEPLGECREISLLADDRDEQVMARLRGELSASAGEVLAQAMLERLPGVVTVAFESAGQLRVLGRPALDYHVGEFVYQVSPGSFFQASRFLLGEMARAVEAETRGKLAVELYAGVGLLTLPLGRKFDEVVACEGNAAAAADLAANARRNGFENVRTVGQSAYDFMRRFAQRGADLLVLDPPRAGVGRPTLELVTNLEARHIHYVSCHPPTLARDLAMLRERGYALESVEMFDFFPRTFHIECLARLQRKS